MTRGVRLYLVGSFVLVSLAGCGRGFFQTAEREPWRAEAEIACLKSGAVKESLDVVRIDPISGPGVCGAEYPLKVASLGEASSSYGFADEDLRPPANIGSNQPRWPVARQPPPATYPPPASAYPRATSYPAAPVRQPGYGAAPGAPISLAPPGIAPSEQDEVNPPSQPVGRSLYMSAPANPPPQDSYPSPSERPYVAAPPPADPLPPLGPARGNPVAAVGPVAVKPAATLACPIVSALDRWLSDSVQPAAQRWFGARVVEIKQISAYSCRGMNGNANAHISEHAFGNALDIAAFTLADGRRIVVKTGWHGAPEEQGFLHDVQGAACDRFTTVLAPGSDAYHYDHMHVDLMRRASGRRACNPNPVSGEEVAARVRGRHASKRGDLPVTGSVLPRRQAGSRGVPNAD